MPELGGIASPTTRTRRDADAEWADLVVTMGCGDACPVIPGKALRRLGCCPRGPGQPARSGATESTAARVFRDEHRTRTRRATLADAQPALETAAATADERDAGEGQRDAGLLRAGDTFLQEDAREHDGDDRVERRQHRRDADEAVVDAAAKSRLPSMSPNPISASDRHLAPRDARATGRRIADGGEDHERRRDAEDERRPPEVGVPGGVHRREVAAEADRRKQREADARRRARRCRLAWCSRDARKTPTSAQAMPASCSADGRSPVAIPTTTGTAAETPAIGATMLIAPTAMPAVVGEEPERPGDRGGDREQRRRVRRALAADRRRSIAMPTRPPSCT